MNAACPPLPRLPLRKLILGLAFAGLVFGPAATLEAASNPAMNRLRLEIRHLKRLADRMKHDERKLRSERDHLTRDLDKAKHYANGGKHGAYRTGFFALLQSFEQTPGQASFLQTYVPALEADNFQPQPEAGFPGGYPADLLHFCKTNHLNLRYGRKAHLIVAELSRDLVYKTENRIAELDQRIAACEAKNVAQNDLLGKLILRAQHCHGCYGCGHHGYGSCGHVAHAVHDHPLAGLQSHAYSTTPIVVMPSRDTAVTDHQRLPFLVPDGPTPLELQTRIGEFDRQQPKLSGK